MSGEIFGTYATAICILIGAFFITVGMIGLLKLNDSMTRLHAPTKVGTLGVGALLLASIIYAFASSDGSLHELLIAAFLFVTAPISANFLSKVNIHRQNCASTPELPDGEKWATLSSERDSDVPR